MAADVDTLLRAAGLRATSARRRVLAWLADHPHATADEVGRGVRAEHGPVSTQAVYDVLRAGVDVGLVHRIDLDGHPARFESRTDDHHHLVCRRCGQVTDVDGVVGAAACRDTPSRAWLAPDSVEVTFWGTCSSCRGARRAA
ncbi:Fur family transcriptional regulator [Pseudonocardia sp. KRD291]|uniref:Fur family transcriptional regulator n=1 Tax=Pseudonocardia sp. KRD291 TaxID=2792007 RepID=UPI001C4A3882|nr:Fur family transcriptional regulator [Pseudonocardia sp. KRD291]MBW0105301.1 transcriptional repressor [Pseudonocardia sp. KRD291]